jgi:hypothetical protein
LLERLGELVNPAFAAAHANEPIEALREAVHECAAQAEIYRNLGFTDGSKAA